MSDIRNGQTILARRREVNLAEEEADRLWETAVTDLFAASEDPLNVLRWKSLYDQLEEALDACEDVANELETITVKHA